MCIYIHKPHVHVAKAMVAQHWHAAQAMLVCTLLRPWQITQARSQGHDMLACMLPRPWQASVGTQPRPWPAPWVGCQGYGMPLHSLEGYGSTWGARRCQGHGMPFQPL